MPGPVEITDLLAEWSERDQSALDNLIPIVYDELRRLASNYMRDERPDHLLQTTALVNAAYLRPIERRRVNCQTRTQFFAVAAHVMRRILLDYARGRNPKKRGEGLSPRSLEQVAILSKDRADELPAIDSALENFTAFDPRKGQVFELRYFGGMSLEEIASALSISAMTAERDWKMAKLWLRRKIAPESEHAT